MKLWQSIIMNIAKKHEGKIKKLDIEKLFEKECYLMLERIKAILEDDSLCDKDCFEKIEAIVSQFEEIGSDCGTRHDFGQTKNNR